MSLRILLPRKLMIIKKTIVFLLILSTSPLLVMTVSAAEPEMTALDRLEKALSEDKYEYSRVGKRDPFRSVLTERLNRREARSREMASKIPFTPLQKFELSSLKLTAIFWGEMGSRAIIDAPDGKGYTVKKGAYVGKNRGVVTVIDRDTIVIDEKYLDIDDTIKTRKVTLKLKTEE